LEALSQKKAKMGRPKLPKGEAKGRIVPVRFTGEDMQTMSIAARKSGLTISELVRSIVRSAFAWVVECKQCGKEFSFRDVDENHPRHAVNNMPADTPAKPPLKNGAEQRQCPHCNLTSTYTRGDLRFKAN
jgi:hypothetical protein